MKVFKQIYALVLPEQRPGAFMVLGLMTLSSVVQVLGVVSIMPFLLVLTTPEIVMQNVRLNGIFESLGFSSVRNFQIALGAATFTVLIASSALRSVAYYAQLRFAQSVRVELSTRIMHCYLTKEYRFFVQNTETDLAKTATQETWQFVDRALMPAASVVNSLLTMMALIILLMLLDPLVTLVMMLFLGAAYATVFFLVRPVLLRSGKARLQAELDQLYAIRETLACIKVIKLGGFESVFLQRFRTPAHTLGRSLTTVSTLQTLPRHAIEAVAFGCIVLLALTLTFRDAANGGSTAGTLLPLLAVYAFAGYRMMPALQQIYSGLANVRFMLPNIERLSKDLEENGRAEDALPLPTAPMPVENSIMLDHVSYTHTAEDHHGIIDVTLNHKAGTSLGVVGHSGAGKTTFLDVLLGLMVPDTGKLLIDGVPIDASNRRAWQKNIGYVPQDIQLAPNSVSYNIAFGVDPDEIDQARVEACAKIAQIHDVVQNDLPEGYHTKVGDRGIRLSGGQRQRLGIARALYFDPSVLVLDEATNALDPITEARVIDALKTHGDGKTRIFVAHRMSTIRLCDQIAVFERGRLRDVGAYEQLVQRSAIFRDLVAADAALSRQPQGATAT